MAKICSSRTLCDDRNCEECFLKSFASHEKVFFWCNNISPRDVSKSSNKKYLFDCDCGHQFFSSLNNICAGQWCPYCSVPAKKLCDKNDCQTCYEKSFKSHPKSIYWSDKNDISPRQILKSSGKKFLFDCDVCNHEFTTSLDNIAKNNWCPYCSVPCKKLCEDNNCNFCFCNSFASSIKAQYWSNKNTVDPREIFLYANKKYYFNCDVCKHEFMKPPSHISAYNEWCPYCTNQKLCDDSDCNFCFCNSFASHPKSKYWSKKNKLEPRQIFKKTTKKYYFKCNTCSHTFNSALGSISNGGWCPVCVNKTEKKVFDWLKNKYENVEPQKKYDWCKNINELPYDFVLEDYKIIIELDGPQHFKQVSNWLDPNLTHKIDLDKMKCANDHGYSVIRILQDDVWQDKINWEEKLETHIEYNENPKNIFICNNNKYDNFMERTINKNLLLKKRILCGFERVEHLENQ